MCRGAHNQIKTNDFIANASFCFMRVGNQKVGSLNLSCSHIAKTQEGELQ
jgi:hypothetical protein